MTQQQSQTQFKSILITVVGQAFAAAGYHLQELPIQQAAGQYRFFKSLPDGLNAFVDWQHLAYVDSEWASGMPSRFRVMLTRTDQPNPKQGSNHPQFAQRDLSALVVEDFAVPILPSAQYWWKFSTLDDLGKALAEAGHLVIGYGMPWLDGSLEIPKNQP